MDSFLLVTQSLGCEQEKPQMEAVCTCKDKNFNRKSDCNIKKNNGNDQRNDNNVLIITIILITMIMTNTSWWTICNFGNFSFITSNKSLSDPWYVNLVMFNLGNTRYILTLNVRGPSYLGLTRSISWLLMPWLLTSPGHQQPWYWLCRICTSWSYWRKDFKYMCHINVD